MWHAAAISSPPPTTAPCSTATTGTLPNSMRSKARCQLRECAIPCATSRALSSPRSRPEQKWSPSPASTAALTPSGRAAKNASMPNTVGWSMALRFSGRARKRTAMSSRRSALSDRGSCTSKPPPDLLTAIPDCHILREFGDISPKRGQALTQLSHDVMDVEPHRARLARAGPERQDAVEPGQARVRCLEPHQRAEIIARRVDRIAARERGYHVGRTVTQPVAGDQDAAAVIGLDPIARLQIRDPVRPHDLPVRAGQDPALEPRPVAAAAENVDHPPLAIGRLPKMPDVAELGVDREDRRLRYHDHRSVETAACAVFDPAGHDP